VSGELVGVPSVGIMTEQFVSAAELMAKVLGMPGYPFVVIDHPISSATLDQLKERARRAAAECAALLTASEQLTR
jgi:hypothetical protein